MKGSVNEGLVKGVEKYIPCVLISIYIRGTKTVSELIEKFFQ